MQNKNSNDRLGLIGKLGSIVQSISISAGSLNEREILDSFVEQGYKDISEEFKILDPKGNINQIATFENFLQNFDANLKYVGRHLKVKNKTEKKQIDLVVYAKNKIWLPELKSSSAFDTKKAKSEVISCVEVATAVLTQLKNLKGSTNNINVVPTIIPWFAKDVEEIEKGFKKHLASPIEFNKDVDAKNILNSELSKNGAKALEEPLTAAYVLKHFNTHLPGNDILSKEKIYKYMVEYFTGEQFCRFFNISFEAINLKVQNQSIELLKNKPAEMLNRKEISSNQKTFLDSRIEMLLSENKKWEELK